MYKIKTYNKISKTGLDVFDDKYTVGDEVENADGAIVRSASLHETEFPESLKAIARAGAGTNNIPIDRCSQKGIVVFNTPGANANAVKELVIAGLLISSRRVISGIEWDHRRNRSRRYRRYGCKRRKRSWYEGLRLRPVSFG